MAVREGGVEVLERTRNGGRLPPKPPTGGRSASPRPPAQGVSDTLRECHLALWLKRESLSLDWEALRLSLEARSLTRESLSLD